MFVAFAVFIVWYMCGLVLAVYISEQRYIDGVDFILAIIGPCVAVFIVINAIDMKKIRNPFYK